MTSLLFWIMERNIYLISHTPVQRDCTAICDRAGSVRNERNYLFFLIGNETSRCQTHHHRHKKCNPYIVLWLHERSSWPKIVGNTIRILFHSTSQTQIKSYFPIFHHHVTIDHHRFYYHAISYTKITKNQASFIDQWHVRWRKFRRIKSNYHA